MERDWIILIRQLPNAYAARDPSGIIRTRKTITSIYTFEMQGFIRIMQDRVMKKPSRGGAGLVFYYLYTC